MRSSDISWHLLIYGPFLAPPSGPVTPTESAVYSPGGSVQLDTLKATRELDTVADGPAEGARSLEGRK